MSVLAVTDPESLDPQQGAGIPVVMLVAPGYNNLLYYDRETGYKITPELAESWDASADGLAYTFKLRKGVTFHDGAPLTVSDVVFNLERMKSPPKGIRSNVADVLEAVDKIQASDDQTVKITMKYPFASFTSALVSDYMPMFSKKTVEAAGDMKKTIMGTGPFKSKSYTPGVSLELVKNENYWVPGRPYLDGITFFIIKDNATRLAALRTGRVMLSARGLIALSPTDVATLKAEVPTMRLLPAPSVAGQWFFMNLRKPPFQDVRVRKAVSLAVDRQAALKIIAQGEGMVGSYFPFAGWGIPRDELLAMPGYRQPKDQDIAAAKKLLAEAGYPDGFAVQILSRNSEVSKTAAVFMSDQLSKLGIKADIRNLEDTVFFESGRKGQHEAMVYGPSTTIADPYHIGRVFAPGAPFNFAGNDDDRKLGELWKRQTQTANEAVRKPIITEVERYLLTDALPAVPLVWPTTFIGVSPQVRGFVPGATDVSNNRHQETWLAP